MEKKETVSLNIRGTNKQVNDVPLDKFLAMCEEMDREKPLELREA